MSEEKGQTQQPGGGGWRVVVGTLAGTFLAGVFLVAVWGKMFDPSAFAEVIRVEGLDFLLPAVLVAYVALGVEALLGLGLLMNLRRLWVLLPTAGLVVFFMVLNLKGYIEYEQGALPAMATCGCFGHLVERTPAEAFWQDAVLLIPPLLLAFLGRPRDEAFPWKRFSVVVSLAVGVAIFSTQALKLPLDDLPFVTRLGPGKSVDEICAGSAGDEVCLSSPEVAPQLTYGNHIVVIGDLTDEAFADAVGERLDELLAWAGDADNPPILLLHAGKKEEEGAFKFRSRFAPLEILAAPRPLLRPLYRTLPRTFLVEDGRVHQTWSGFPALAEIAARQRSPQ